MSYRIEEKLSIDSNRIIDFKSFLANKTVKPIYQPRRIQSLYFDNQNYEMYTDSIEGLTPRKKIRVRNYPEDKNSTLHLEFKISSVEGRFKTRKIINKENFRQIKKIGINDNGGFIEAYNKVIASTGSNRKMDGEIILKNKLGYNVVSMGAHRGDGFSGNGVLNINNQNGEYGWSVIGEVSSEHYK